MDPEVLSEADFRTLGLEPGSKPSEVRQAYRALVKKWHPDRHHSKSYESRALAEKSSGKSTKLIGVFPGAGNELLDRRIWQGAAAPRNRHPLAGCLRKHTRHPCRRSRLKSLFQSFSRAKIVWPALLSVAAALHFDATSFVFSGYTGIYGNDLHRGPPKLAPDAKRPKQSQSHRQTSRATVLPPLLRLRPPFFAPCPAPVSACGASFFSPWDRPAPKCSGIQGTPSRVQGQTWTYGLSEVQFRNGRVCSSTISTGHSGCACSLQCPEDRELPDHIYDRIE